MGWKTRLLIPCATLVMVCGCGSEGGEYASNTSGTGGSSGSSGGASGHSPGYGGSGGYTGPGGTGSHDEVCDGLDNSGDGQVDEICTCATGETQECYPAPTPPPAGCSMGTQTCNQLAWGACTGQRMPAPGEDSCCEVGVNTSFEVYDAFVAAYPASEMPNGIKELPLFSPVAGEYKMTWSAHNHGNEFVDNDIGGISEANLFAGRDYARAKAEEAIPSDGTIVAVKDGPANTKIISGPAPCNGIGWAWGSLLYQREDFSVGEMVYLYIGYCAQLPTDTSTEDSEGFYYSDEPVVVCSAPVVVK